MATPKMNFRRVEQTKVKIKDTKYKQKKHFLLITLTYILKIHAILVTNQDSALYLPFVSSFFYHFVNLHEQ
jgi:hypothetical protein